MDTDIGAHPGGDLPAAGAQPERDHEHQRGPLRPPHQPVLQEDKRENCNVKTTFIVVFS